MDTDGLIAQFRREADDRQTPYLWSDEDVQAWLDEAEQEAAIRAHMLPERVNADLCQIAVTADTDTYELHESVLTIRHARFVGASGNKQTLKVVSPDGMDAINPCWRDDSAGQPYYLVQDEQTAILVPTPSDAGTVHMEVFRLPLESFADKNEPEIGGAHHRHLVNWALFKAFSKPDAEALDKSRAAEAESRFNAYFGLRTDAQLGRDMQADQPHHNQAW